MEKRNTIGAPGPEAMEKVIAMHEEALGRLSEEIGGTAEGLDAGLREAGLI